jgi:hypothetical protein
MPKMAKDRHNLSSQGMLPCLIFTFEMIVSSVGPFLFRCGNSSMPHLCFRFYILHAYSYVISCIYPTSWRRRQQIFGESEAVYMGDEEIRELNRGDIGGFLENFKDLYGSYNQHGQRIQLGFKCPGTILKSTALRSLSQYFPDTKIIVSLRHPITW